MNKINILCVIDDDQIYSFLLKRILLKVDFVEKTIFFENGQLALDFIHEFKDRHEQLPDLILLDLNMPVLDGWQFMDQFVTIIPELDKNIPVYIASSSIDENDYNRALSIEQVSDFIVKPINLKLIKEIVEKM